MIDPAKLGIGRQKYYLEQLARNYDEYLSGHGEAPGYTIGSAWSTLGISGMVTPEQFENVFAGAHPDTGKLLGRAHRGADGVLAYDFVTRPAKSVALLWAFGTPEMRGVADEATHEAARVTIAYLERFAYVRRGRNGVEVVRATGLLGTAFDHRASRPGDPLPHTHNVIVNRAQGRDGRWTALDGRPLLAELKNADALFRATYQRIITERLGLEWGEPDAEGNRELVGIPDEVIRHFSKAAEAINAECERREAEGLPVTSKVRSWVAHQVREGKCHEPAGPQRERWDAECAAKGWDLRATFIRLAGRVRAQDQLTDPERDAIFDRLDSPDGLTGESSTFTRGEVIRAIGNRVATLSAAEIERLADRFLAERTVEKLIDRKTQQPRYSTPELCQVERQVVDRAATRQTERRHVVPSGTIRAVLEHYERLGKPLGADQAEVLRSVCTDGGGLSLVVGRAGTGKTFTMDAVRAAYEAANATLPERERVTVRGFAPTGIAATELDAGAGIDATTVDRFLLDLRAGRDALESTDVVIVDESNMLGTRRFAALQKHADRVGAKIIAVGDDKQLQSIDTGGWFRGLRLRHGAAELTVNRRQRDRLDQQAVELIRDGLGEQAMALYRDGGRVTVAKTAAQAHDAMIADWWKAFADEGDAIMLAHRRVEVDTLNDLGHAAMAAADRLTGPALTARDREFQAGDRVVCGANSLDKLGIANGTKGWITAVDPDQHAVTITTDADKQVTLPASYLRQKLSNDRRALDHAYATTGHKSEGITVDRAFIRGGSGDRHWGYTVLTRVRERADLYLVEGPAVPERDDAGVLDLAPPRSQDPYDIAVAALGRVDPQRMAIDADRDSARPLVSSMSTRELREERDQLARIMRGRPRPVVLSFRQTVEQRADVEEQLAAARDRQSQLESWLASHGRGLAGLARRGEVKAAQAEVGRIARLDEHLSGRLSQLEGREREFRRHEQHRAAWDEAHTPETSRDREVRAELAWRTRARTRAHEAEPPGWLDQLLGPRPDSRRGQRAWRAAATRAADYRDRYQITDERDGLGPQPREFDQRRAWRACHDSIDRVRSRGRDTSRGMTISM